jgi:hypothetical protein
VSNQQLPHPQLLSMKDTEKALKEELSPNFNGHGQRLNMMSKLVLAVLKMCTVNFAELSQVINAAVKVESNFKRIQRFMKGYSFCQRCFVQFAWSFYGTQGDWVALSMDRTNWKFGQLNINILTIGISWRGTAIPLVWMMLNKRGQSNQSERILLLENLLNYLTVDQRKRIRYVLMDREFGAHDWITYLKSKPFSFVIRIRKDARVRKPGQFKEQLAWKLFQDERFKALRKPRVIFGHRLYIAGQRISKTEYLILISDQPLSHGRQIYGERWGIEVFFGCLKKRGFNFEDTHLTKLERINTLIFILAIAFIWAFKTGEILLENGHQIPIKNLKNRKAKLYSIFRVGLDHLKHKLLNFLSLFNEIELLSCT